FIVFFFQAEDGIRDRTMTGVQTCALPICGSVINLSSISSANPVPNSVVYSASKAAVDAITKALANELAGRKIRVNAIAPGMTERSEERRVGKEYRWRGWSEH